MYQLVVTYVTVTGVPLFIFANHRKESDIYIYFKMIYTVSTVRLSSSIYVKNAYKNKIIKKTSLWLNVACLENKNSSTGNKRAKTMGMQPA